MTSYPVLPSQKGAHYTSMEAYKKDYNASLTENSTYWGKAALEHLDWFTPFTSTTSGDLFQGDTAWFLNGKLNVSYNCIDRHVQEQGDKVAIIWEADEVGEGRSITYREECYERSWNSER